MGKYDVLKEQVLRFSQRGYAERLFTGTSGNLSIIDRPTDTIIITPSGIDYLEMRLDDLVMIDMEGNVLEGRQNPSSEWKLHAELYRNRPDISSVVHTHSPYASSFAVSGEEIPVILIEMIGSLGGSVKVAPFAVSGSREVGETAVEAMQGRYACLLKNHGVVTIGQDISQAYMRAAYVEDAAIVYHLAKMNGRVDIITEDFCDKELSIAK